MKTRLVLAAVALVALAGLSNRLAHVRHSNRSAPRTLDS